MDNFFEDFFDDEYPDTSNWTEEDYLKELGYVDTQISFIVYELNRLDEYKQALEEEYRRKLDD